MKNGLIARETGRKEASLRLSIITAHARHLKAARSRIALRLERNRWMHEVLTYGGKVDGT